MAESADVTVQQLFKKWRSGDAESGQSMAQRFSDWYYAIAAVIAPARPSPRASSTSNGREIWWSGPTA